MNMHCDRLKQIFYFSKNHFYKYLGGLMFSFTNTTNPDKSYHFTASDGIIYVCIP